MKFLTSFILLASIFHPTVSATNFSFPLPVADLAIRINGSETDGRRKLDFNFLYGGFSVIGVSDTPSGEQERSCTLSFPAMNNQTGKKGFLTSNVCVGSNLFVGANRVGNPTSVNGFDRGLGLDYMFVEVLEQFWHDLTSKKVAFADQLNDNIFDLLSVNIPAQIPFVNITVCAYGGNSEFVCGMILEFNVTIKSWDPGSDGSESPPPFNNVVKVQMEKDYTKGDLGAPVYISGLIPFSSPSEFIVSPVGQVVEDSEESEEANIWFYTPIDVILENDSDLVLLTMDPEKEEIF